MDMELIQTASALHQQSQELEEKVGFIQNQISELEDFTKSLNSIISTKETSMLSSLGKGVFVKTNLEEKKLFVEVGSGIIVRKTPEETKEVIQNQIKRLLQLKVQLSSQLDSLQSQLRIMIEQIENSQN
jgi:prefoldin alpha subunit